MPQCLSPVAALSLVMYKYSEADQKIISVYIKKGWK